MYAPFVISGILEENITDKVAFTNANLLEDTLNAHLKLENYGEGVKGIAFLFIVTAPADTIHVESFRYRKKDQEMHIQMRLPYATVESMRVEDVLPLMAKKYLDTMREKLPSKHIPGFDWAHFTADLQDLFERKGWLMGAAVV
jgi:hypothetical protein